MRSFLARLIGSETDFPLEHRLLNIVLVFGFALSIWSAITNFLLNLSSLLVWTCIITTGILGGLHYLSIAKKQYKLTLVILLTAVLFIVPASWITNGGVNGSIPFYIILFSSMGSSVFFGIQRYLAVAYLIVIANILMIFEYLYPGLIVGYASNADRYIDLAIGLISTITVNTFLFTTILDHYAKEQKKAQKYLAQSRQAQNDLLYLSYHDALTGLYNRTYFEKELQLLEQRAANLPGVFVIDVDGLKFVNDTFGHQQGDSMLKRAAKILSGPLTADDILARIGGDEFVIFIHEGSPDNMEAIQAELIAQLAADNRQLPGQLPLEMSIGYASPQPRQTIRDILREADNTMYRKKLVGKTASQKPVMETIKQLAATRPATTANDRFCHIIGDFSAAVGMDAADIANIRLFAQFHDIGSVGIADTIFNKPGPLSPDEKKEVQRHCEIGYRIALSSPELQPVADWILKHHEWWNGKGYPLGLTGADIPLECRIITIAAAYHALTSNRPYRQTATHEEALHELARYSGTQFDPELLKTFSMLTTFEQHSL